jgi:hypothetical protein
MLVKSHTKPNTRLSLTVEAHIYIGDTKPNQIRILVGKMVGSAIHLARKQKTKHRFVQVGYVYLVLYDTELRRRSLGNQGLSKDLIATIRFQKNPMIRAGDIATAHVETLGPYRVCWNKNWKSFGSVLQS